MYMHTHVYVTNRGMEYWLLKYHFWISEYFFVTGKTKQKNCISFKVEIASVLNGSPSRSRSVPSGEKPWWREPRFSVPAALAAVGREVPAGPEADTAPAPAGKAPSGPFVSAPLALPVRAREEIEVNKQLLPLACIKTNACLSQLCRNGSGPLARGQARMVRGGKGHLGRGGKQRALL